MYNFFSFIKTIYKIEKHYRYEYFNIRNNVEDIVSPNCGIFQIYFYKNLFHPEEKSKIINHENLNKKTIETIINEIFSTDIDENEHLIKKFKEEYDL